jgi:predicted Zn-dependent protease with MMP-like domain
MPRPRALPPTSVAPYLWRMTEEPAPNSTAPSLAFIEQLAHEAVSTLPEPFRAPATHVRIRVEEFADDTMLEELGIDDAFDLTGLYDGIPLTEKSTSEQVIRPDVVWLFRRPILDEWAERGDVSITDLVSHVVIHELAHHFGWSDEEISAIDRWWE